MNVLVAQVGGAAGSRAAAAALACAASDEGRSALLVDLDAVRPPRPTPIATTAARALEERLAAELPGMAVAARGKVCHLMVAEAGVEGGARLEPMAVALSSTRDAPAVVHLRQSLFQVALDDARIRPAGVLLRADVREDRALTALVVGDLLERGVEVVVLKRALPWLAARAALLGALGGRAALPPRVGRLLPC